MILSYLTYQDKYAGIKAVGTSKVKPFTGAAAGFHMFRAFYITAQLEAPIWGCVQSYDGCGMSGGPLHFTAVLPKTMEQGSLFGLLRKIETVKGSAGLDLWDALAKVGWYVAKDGKLRSTKNGAIVAGKDIRNTFTPPNGLVPKSGAARKQAEMWATLFCNLLSDEKTFADQIDHSIEYLVRSSQELELKAYRLFVPKIQSPEIITIQRETKIPESVDLAMCVYHAFTPNAPAIAKQCLEATLLKVGSKPDPLTFAQTLIKTLGTKNYGRWKDVPGTKGSRYDATRNVCIASNLWTRDLLDATMPVDFK